MAEQSIAAASASRGPDGVLVPGTQHDKDKGGFARFAVVLGTDVSHTCTYPHLTDSFETAIVAIKGATVVLDAGEELDLILQTTYDGFTWVDVRNVHYANAETLLPAPYVVMTVTTPPPTAQSTMVEGELATSVFLDGALADDTEVDIPLGIGVRLKVLTTNAATGDLTVSIIVR